MTDINDGDDVVGIKIHSDSGISGTLEDFFVAFTGRISATNMTHVYGVWLTSFSVDLTDLEDFFIISSGLECFFLYIL